MFCLPPHYIQYGMSSRMQQNWYDLTGGGSEKIVLFAADQKFELGSIIHPEKIFDIAASEVRAPLATQFELVAHYAKHLTPQNTLVIKLNSMTRMVSPEHKDPHSSLLCDVSEVLNLQRYIDQRIVGIGYTIYLGSEYEREMIEDACKHIKAAHHAGLLAIIWLYARGKSVENEYDPRYFLQAASMAPVIGADVIKVKIPETKTPQELQDLYQQARLAAGYTSILFSGGAKVARGAEFLHQAEHLCKTVGFDGCAVGRNIFEREQDEAEQMLHLLCNTIL